MPPRSLIKAFAGRINTLVLPGKQMVNRKTCDTTVNVSVLGAHALLVSYPIHRGPVSPKNAEKNLTLN